MSISKGFIVLNNDGYGYEITPTAGSIVYAEGTGVKTTAAGTSGQVLKSNGAAAPAFDDLNAAADAYTPSTPADWNTPPTTIQEALDMIASALGPI